jgi:hypothetical protein
MIEERRGGIWNRLLVADVKPNQFLFSHLGWNSFLMILQACEFFAYSAYVALNFNWNFAILIFSLLVLVGLAGILYGLFVSVITNSAIAAGSACSVALYPFISLCGK